MFDLADPDSYPAEHRDRGVYARPEDIDWFGGDDDDEHPHREAARALLSRLTTNPDADTPATDDGRPRTEHARELADTGSVAELHDRSGLEPAAAGQQEAAPIAVQPSEPRWWGSWSGEMFEHREGGGWVRLGVGNIGDPLPDCDGPTIVLEAAPLSDIEASQPTAPRPGGVASVPSGLEALDVALMSAVLFMLACVTAVAGGWL